MKYYDDFYSFVIYKLELQKDIKEENRNVRDVLSPIFGTRANKIQEELKEEYAQLQMTEWENFQIWTDIQIGLLHTPDDMSKDISLSSATIRKRLDKLQIPKYNGNESNPFGKRFIPDCIYGRLKELVEEYK